ncbi:MAG: hypothetical protein ACJATW_002881 [Glaciecola sp.]
MIYWLINSLFLSSLLLSTFALAQQQIGDNGIDLNSTKETIQQQTGRELKVLAPTLTAEEIDPAVLNRLLQEIAREPETIKTRLAVSDSKLQDIFITLSNARTFINTNEMANIRVMCQAWDRSTLADEDRIREALNAYEKRDGFTKRFIANFYGIVLSDIQYGLSEQGLLSFNNYMDDRRRRMASAGSVTTGITTQNARSGAEAVTFHCGPAR